MARHWIDGAWLESEVVAHSYSPATGQLLGRFADGGDAEARAAVYAARRAFAGTVWGRDRALREVAPDKAPDGSLADDHGMLMARPVILVIWLFE
jgi:betaine-aldehyde dehydrogenase